MLADLVASLVGLGRDTTEVRFHKDPGLPTKVFLQHGNSLQEIAAPPPLRLHLLAGFDDLVSALKDTAIAPSPEVYVAAGQVVALLDRGDRRQTVTVKLAESKRWQTIVALQQPKAMQPRDAVKMLRLELHGGNVGHVIQALSRIDFARSSAGSTNVAHGRESLGRSVEATVQQADAVPQQFTLAVPVWSTAGFSRFGVQIEFGVFLDLEAQVVELRVLADEVERARNLALAAVVGELQARLPNVPVFLGTP